jgi:hypothetical protein
MLCYTCKKRPGKWVGCARICRECEAHWSRTQWAIILVPIGALAVIYGVYWLVG